MNVDLIYQIVNRTALTLRGMTMDPRIPEDTKEVMRDLIEGLEGAEDQLAEDE
jgi:hypothetical protein